MFYHIEGRLSVLSPTRAVLDAGGVGYELRIPLSTYSVLKGREQARLFTHLQVLDDDLRLYGFATEKERELFRLATSISGVGPGIALSLLASFSPGELGGVIAAGDSRALRRIKGVGAKRSELLLGELRRRSEALAAIGGDGAIGDAAANADAVAALVELGFERAEAQAKVQAAVRRLLERGGPPPGVEIIIQTVFRGGG